MQYMGKVDLGAGAGQNNHTSLSGPLAGRQSVAVKAYPAFNAIAQVKPFPVRL